MIQTVQESSADVLANLTAQEAMVLRRRFGQPVQEMDDDYPFAVLQTPDDDNNGGGSVPAAPLPE
ncbi:MAG: hypothetical protein KTR35_11280 [Gammaproteobacteria bacterium]|nr:hypothetical protein [Gammaproteobacteria bacterium]